MTYKETLNAYESLLKENRGKALRIGDGCYAALIDGHLCGIYSNLDGQPDPATAFDLDQSAWDTDCECWDGDVSGLETSNCIASPVYEELPCQGKL
ncbi:hypothetical protein [Pseudomonas sp. 2FE]|uniref:hypothetical protein n=1 Tax=Pseudomonas sp. 2FE TaxID=2502190 RepID=UPI0010FA5590|nr:hypothetical protein [Pseudomonas sp. 2FE]